MPVPAWPASPGVSERPTASTPADASHHFRNGCSEAGWRESRIRSNGKSRTSSARRTSDTRPYRVSSTSPNTVGSKTFVRGSADA